MKFILYIVIGECVMLGCELGKGGEGVVYDIEEFVDSVVKIYYMLLFVLKQDKFVFMVVIVDVQLLNYVVWLQVMFYGG